MMVDGCSGLLWAALGRSGVLWGALGCSGLLWAALGCSGLLWALWAHILSLFAVIPLILLISVFCCFAESMHFCGVLFAVFLFRLFSVYFAWEQILSLCAVIPLILLISVRG